MNVISIETVLRRDRTIVAIALAAIAVLAWIYILMLIRQMDHGMSASAAGPHAGLSMAGMDMTGMTMAGMNMSDMDMQHLATTGMTALMTPRFTDLPVLALMWSVMMIGMMTPSAAPMILLYARVARQAAAKGQPFATTSWFAAGYLLAWIGFSLVVSVAQIWLQRQALLTPEMESDSRLFSGFLMLAAGLFQWGPLKDACLSECRMPLRFIQRHGGFRREVSQSLRLGILHGSYCVGCCWALMALLFVGGVMNMLWIAGLSILVLLEKMMPLGRDVARVIGAALFAGGGWLVLSELI